MPCAPEGFSGNHLGDYRFRFRNWLGTVDLPVSSYFEPDSLESLVWVVQQASRGGHRLKVIGSGWSFEDIAACPDWIVSLRLLNNIIPDVIGGALSTRSALTDSWQRRITRRSGTTRLVHVEAGIVLFDLNRRLHDMRLAMLTLGGSQGQTLAGALSTSTHGGDVGQTPLADVVRAVHLVTEDGQEMWVESASDPLTTDARLRPKFACPDGQIIRDDELLQALQVSVGRFGVIYSYVLEVRPKFNLLEWAVPSTWADTSALLREGLTAGNMFGPLGAALPRPRRRSSGTDDILIEESSLGARYLEFLINPRSGGSQLWVRRRWEITSERELAVPGADGFDVLEDVHGAANWILQGAALAIRLAIPRVVWIPGYGIGRSIEMNIRATELDFMALDSRMTVPRALVASLNALWACDEFGEFGLLIDELVRTEFDGNDNISTEHKRGVSWQVMAGLNAGDPNGPRVNSIEMVFDATTTNYIDFIDFLVGEGPHHRQAGYISVRYSKGSDALLSMHNVASGFAVSIEVASLVGFEHNARWIQGVEARGIELGGRPHWGQQNTLQHYQVQRTYGDKLNAWREQLVRVAGTARTFSNNYTEQRGLEPVAILRDVTAVRRADGRITHLCNPGQYWSPMPVEDVINAFDSEHTLIVGGTIFPPRPGSINYQTRPADSSIPSARIGVQHVLSSAPDDNPLNNLSALPLCTDHHLILPPADLLRRRVTSVTRNTWGGITALCNAEEHWRIPDVHAFLEIASGRIEYFIDRTGAEVLLQARSFVSTVPDGVEENNLDNLPEA